MENSDFRVYIKTRARLGFSATAISDELTAAYPGQAPQYSCVAKWTKLFREGRESVEDDPRPGRPITAHTRQSISLVRQIVDDDPHVTYAIIYMLWFVVDRLVSRTSTVAVG